MTNKNMEEGLKPRSIGRENIEMIFRLIQRKEKISRTDIAKLSGLSKTAVSSSVDQLLEEELIRENKQSHYSRVGRKPLLLSVKPNGKHFISVDVGGS
ncbi:winged helix-turn-helix domain-containing protein, partial [Candidatus Bipolaricaulota bacterium]|nr:winged helix-turn-helix domain-containing protein [Candidatus Bipolaricaulota bacterium]